MNNQQNLEQYHERRENWYIGRIQDAPNIEEKLQILDEQSSWIKKLREYLGRISESEGIRNFLEYKVVLS